MTDQLPPPVDPRTSVEIEGALLDAVEVRTDWRRSRPNGDGSAPDQPDGVDALVGIAASLTQLVRERLNRALGNHERAFLNVIGVTRRGPTAARAPLTFRPVAGHPPGLRVPAGTRAEAPPPPGDTEPIVFETDRELPLTDAVPIHAFFADERDRYADLSGACIGEPPEEPMQLSPVHETRWIYVGLDQHTDGLQSFSLLAPDGQSLEPDDEALWETFDGETWRAVARNGATISAEPAFSGAEFADRDLVWIRTRPSQDAIDPADGSVRRDQTPTAARITRTGTFRQAFLGGVEIDTSAPFHPLGSNPSPTDPLYIALSDPVESGTAITVTMPSADATGSNLAELDLILELWTDTGWSRLSNGLPGPRTQAASAEGEFFGIRTQWLRARLDARPNTTIKRWPPWGHDWNSKQSPDPAPMAESLNVSYDSVFDVEAAQLLVEEFGKRAQPAKDSLSRPAFERGERRRGDDPLTFFIGFDRSFGNQAVEVFVDLADPRPDDVTPDAVFLAERSERSVDWWRMDASGAWHRLEADDETRGFRRSGAVRFVSADVAAPTTLFGSTARWLRADLAGAAALPRIARISVNTTWASEGETQGGEVLQRENGGSTAIFRTTRTPVLPGWRLTVDEGGGPETWTAVEHFGASGPDDHHVVVDVVDGTISFGDGDRGRRAPTAPRSVALSYRTGGGSRGNVGVGAISELASSVPYIDEVTNHRRATGGANGATLERTAREGPKQLRHRGRAVTADDVTDTIIEAFPEIARARVLPAGGPVPTELFVGLDANAGALHRTAMAGLLDRASELRAHGLVTAGTIGVVVVPDLPDLQPIPDVELIERIRRHLQDRMPPTVRPWVAGPSWYQVSVDVTVHASPSTAGGLVARVHAALDAFLHPLSGGTDALGWKFGVRPYGSDVLRMLLAMDHVERVGDLRLVAPDEGTIRATDLVHPGAHRVTLAFAEVTA